MKFHGYPCAKKKWSGLRMSSGVSFRATLPNCRGQKLQTRWFVWVIGSLVRLEHPSAYWNPQQSMGLIYLPTFTIKTSQMWVNESLHGWYMGIEIPKRSRTATWRWKKHGFEDVGIQESIIASGFSRSDFRFRLLSSFGQVRLGERRISEGEPKIYKVLWEMSKINHSQKVGFQPVLNGVTTPTSRVITLVINL